MRSTAGAERTRPDAVILGAGAAGLMCAISAGRRGRRVLVLEHGERPGAKILISGGGRCNFTNLRMGPECFVSANPRFCVSALSRYQPRDFIALVQAHGIAYHEKTLGQLFCDGSARQIVAMLLAECARAGVEIRLGERVTQVAKGEANFRIETERASFEAPALVLASGGLSIPKLGASSLAYQLARRFGLAVIEPRPALTPLRLGGRELAMAQALSGMALGARVSCGAVEFSEAILFTHRGLSGPAILQISSYWRPGARLALDLMPGREAERWLKARKRERPKAALATILAEALPARLAQMMAEPPWAPEALGAGPIAGLPDRALGELAAWLRHWEVLPMGLEGWDKAEVTAGGIDTAELSSRTMEARKVGGLYAVGEAVDVTGWLGGYNFQWAWASGWCAGQAL